MDDFFSIVDGKYSIKKQLGQGGMGSVYLAHDAKLDRDVAIKFILRGNCTAEEWNHLLLRFDREAKALAKLTHPNIIPIIDYGKIKENPYLVMPYMSGGTLTHKLGQPLSWLDCVHLIKPIASGLAYAHKQGFIHRDIKPGNILITENGDPVLADFGLVKQLNPLGSQTLTNSGILLGTPFYMSPEQAKTPNSVDGRTDIYSLGIIFYQLITGKAPFSAETYIELFEKQIKNQFSMPSVFINNLPGAVEEVICKAMNGQAEDRYQSMNDFIEALSDLEVVSYATGNNQNKIKIPGNDSGSFPPWLQDLQIHENNQASPNSIALTDQLSAQKAEPEEEEKATFTEEIGQIAFSAHENILVIALRNRICFYHSNDLQGIRSFNTKSEISGIAVSPNGNFLASGSIDHTIRLWDIVDGKLSRVFEGNTNGVNSVAFSPNGEFIASGSKDNTISLWSMSDGKLSRKLEGHVDSVNSVAYSPNGKFLSSGSKDKTIKIWRVVDGRLLHTLEGHTDSVNSVAFSTNGKFLASGSNDTTIRLWQAVNGHLLCRFEGHNNAVTSIAFSPHKGEFLVSGSRDQTVRIWKFI